MRFIVRYVGAFINVQQFDPQSDTFVFEVGGRGVDECLFADELFETISARFV